MYDAHRDLDTLESLIRIAHQAGDPDAARGALESILASMHKSDRGALALALEDRRSWAARDLDRWIRHTIAALLDYHRRFDHLRLTAPPYVPDKWVLMIDSPMLEQAEVHSIHPTREDAHAAAAPLRELADLSYEVIHVSDEETTTIGLEAVLLTRFYANHPSTTSQGG